MVSTVVAELASMEKREGGDGEGGG